MSSAVKTDLRAMSDRLPDSATYSDAMYELYVRMKVAMGKAAVEAGKTIPHEVVRRRFAK